MKRKLVAEPSQPSVAISPQHSARPELSSDPRLATRRDGNSSRPSKLRRHGTWLLSALRSLTNSASDRSVADLQRDLLASTETLTRVPASRSVVANGLTRMTSTLFRTPKEPTVIRRPSSTRIPVAEPFRSLNTLHPLDEPLTSFPTPDSSPGSSQNSKSNSNPLTNTINSANGSTGATSLDSIFHASSVASIPKDASVMGSERPQQLIQSSRQGGSRRNPTQSSPDSNLTTIQETVVDQCSPSVLTVERAAAAKIYLETYFNQVLTPGPSPRDIRLRLLEVDLFNYYGTESLTAPELEAIHMDFCRRETDHLRETRVMKTRTMCAMAAKRGNPKASLCEDYEVLKILGKGSFGVVRLVQEKACLASGSCPPDETSSSPLRAPDSKPRHQILVYTVTLILSFRIVPLIESFEDISNLYLVMEYMPGGDFLGLLIRENTIHESVARFYVAEMVLCVEAAHALQCIHRDIKPDNFLISASGHLKIADFGLAFDGHWSHDTSYYNSHRYSLLKTLGINVQGDQQDKEELRRLQATGKNASYLTAAMGRHAPSSHDGEPLLNWRNRCGNRTSAMSVVGTSQYMAPEVIEGKSYDGRGPAGDETEDHHKEIRLCSERYRLKDLATAATNAGPSLTANNYGTRERQQESFHDFAGCYVFPQDAEEIKAHKWFSDISWEQLHQTKPPLVPHLSAQDDTRYFDDEEDISDWSETGSSEDDSQGEECEQRGLNDENQLYPGAPPNSSPSYFNPPRPPPPTLDSNHNVAGGTPQVKEQPALSRQRLEEAQMALRAFRPSVQQWALEAIAQPYDLNRLRDLDCRIDRIHGLGMAEKTMLRQFLRVFGRKDRRRARDRLLRDQNTKGLVMEERKRNAFVRYTWRRMRPPGLVDHNLWQNSSQAVEGTYAVDTLSDAGISDEFENLIHAEAMRMEWESIRAGAQQGHDGFLGWGDQHVAIPAMQRGRMSWR
ncbi:kinase-like domain-containing protein [Rhypophila decipiens]|uniref:non-specific serine/threonine protein kinase n=1 Tax=Rhypophila decipiens TaxID=261697 RepID=A0AAN6YPV4_9PEZI|nr:kinase-like domain-containing protein [Rhypophila decipiens]